MIELKLEHKIVRDILEADENFSVKVKTAVLNTALKQAVWKNIEPDLKDAINKEIADCKRTHFDIQNRGIKLAPGVIKLIEAEVKDILQSEIRKAVAEAKQQVENNLSALITEELNNAVKKKVNERLLQISEELK